MIATYKKLAASSALLSLTLFACLVFGQHKAAAYTLESGTGYFSGSTVSTDGDDVNSDVIGPRPAIPTYVYDGVGNDKLDYINWLRGIVTPGTCASGRNEVGGAFIVNTMLGTPASQRTKCISWTMWGRLVAAINDSDVGMVATNYSAAELSVLGGGKTSFYSTQAGGDNFYDTWSYVFSRDVVHFYSKSTGRQLYYIEVPCANPLPEGVAGLPEDPVGNLDAADCSDANITGWVLDMDDPNTAERYIMVVNGTRYGPTATNVYNGPLNARYGVSGNHGFSRAISSFAAYNPRDSNTIELHAIDTDTGVESKIDTLTLGPCAKGSCGPNTFPAAMVVGTPQSFNVQFNLNYVWGPPYAGSPTYNPAISVTVKAPDGSTSYARGNVPYSAGSPATATLTTNTITFTPTQSGTYRLTYQLIGSGVAASVNTPVCNDTSSAVLQPFFGVTGGDIVAGAGFGDGTCTENTNAAIKGQNRNTPTYAGAGVEQAAWATGTISNFVSGMGLAGGAPAQAGKGLSFANTGGANIASPNYGGSFRLGSAAGANSLPCTPDYYARAAGSNVGNNYSVNGIPANSGTVNQQRTSGGVFTINGGVLRPGNNVNLYFQGDVLITGDLTYAAYDISNIPRFNLHVLGNIYIAPGVHDLYGVYTAQKSATGGGHIITCANNAGDVTVASTACNSQLRFHGSVASEDTMVLARTFGNIVAVPSATVDPAEDFDYPPEVWLSAPGTFNAVVQSYTSLPPVL